MKTGDVIKRLRMQEGLTQQELAERLGVATSSVKKYERNAVMNLKLSTIQELCKIFKVAPYAFVFPEAWIGSQMLQGDNLDVYKFTAIYTILTDEAKMKTLSYMEDLSQVERYIRPDYDQYKDIHDTFLTLGGGKRPDQN